MKKISLSSWIIGITICSIVFIIAAVSFHVFEFDMLPSQFFGALIGVVITAIITVLLLKGQTDNAEKLEKNVKIFEHKQEVYHAFIDKLREILKDGEITINSTTDELKELIFQLGYMQMHASEETMDEVLNHLAIMMRQNAEFNALKDTDKQHEIANFYADFSNELFCTIAAIKKDLYGEDCRPIAQNRMSSILQQCGLFVETGEIDKYELQYYFWDRVQKGLKEKGYDFEYKDFKADVNEYYAHKGKNRQMHYGFDVPVYTTKDNLRVIFRVEIENNIYYGFRHFGCVESSKVENKEKDNELCNLVTQTSSSFDTTSQWWVAWKYTDRNKLEFWSLESEGIEKMQNPRSRELCMRELVDEMDMYIKKFIALSEEQEF